MIFNFFKHIFCSGGGSVASLGGVRDLPLARSHHLQLLCQLLHLYLQGGFSLIYFHLYFTCLKHSTYTYQLTKEVLKNHFYLISYKCQHCQRKRSGRASLYSRDSKELQVTNTMLKYNTTDSTCIYSFAKFRYNESQMSFVFL